MRYELERYRIAQRVYTSHPDRARLAELLGLSARERDALEQSTADPDQAGGCTYSGCACLHPAGGCTYPECSCPILGGRR